MFNWASHLHTPLYPDRHFLRIATVLVHNKIAGLLGDAFQKNFMSCYFGVCSKLYLVLLPLPVLFCVFSSTLCQILHFLPLCVSLCCDCAPPYYVPPLPNYPSPLCMSPPVSMSDCLCIMCWALQQFPPCARLPVSLTLSVFDFFSSAFSLWLCFHGSTNNPCTEQFLPQVEFFFFNFNTASGVMHLSLPVPANQSLPVSVICYNSNILTARLIYHDNQLFSYSWLLLVLAC